MSKYTISFIPKKDGNSIDRKDVEPVKAMLGSIHNFLLTDFEQKKMEKGSAAHISFNQAIAAIKTCSSGLIETGNIRTICAPNESLKGLQRAILSNLSRIPAHQNAHGFVRNRDSMSCAMAHTEYWGKDADHLVILNMDAKNFFHSITSPIVRKALEAHGIKPKDADGVIASCMLRADESLAASVISGLMKMLQKRTSIHETDLQRYLFVQEAFAKNELDLPEGTLKKMAFAICQGFLSLGHGVTMVNKFLPQGAPTSPCLSNLSMKIVDIRLSAMAKSFGGFYTRYADDFTVSWKAPTKGKIIDGMYRCTGLTLAEYSVILNRRKKRVMGRGKRQDIVGFCVNSGKPTVSKKIRNRLRASIHNEMVRGSKRFHEGDRKVGKFEDHKNLSPSPQRISYLMGHIGRIQASHPKEAERYRVLLDVAMNRTEANLHAFQLSSDEVQNDDSFWG